MPRKTLGPTICCSAFRTQPNGVVGPQTAFLHFDPALRFIVDERDLAASLADCDRALAWPRDGRERRRGKSPCFHGTRLRPTFSARLIFPPLEFPSKKRCHHKIMMDKKNDMGLNEQAIAKSQFKPSYGQKSCFITIVS